MKLESWTSRRPSHADVRVQTLVFLGFEGLTEVLALDFHPTDPRCLRDITFKKIPVNGDGAPEFQISVPCRGRMHPEINMNFAVAFFWLVSQCVFGGEGVYQHPQEQNLLRLK